MDVKCTCGTVSTVFSHVCTLLLLFSFPSFSFLIFVFLFFVLSTLTGEHRRRLPEVQPRHRAAVGWSCEDHLGLPCPPEDGLRRDVLVWPLISRAGVEGSSRAFHFSLSCFSRRSPMVLSLHAPFLFISDLFPFLCFCFCVFVGATECVRGVSERCVCWDFFRGARTACTA